MSEHIEAKVAKVLTDNEVVLNRGRQAGVAVGMVFEIGDGRLEDLVDPDTGDSLGSIEASRAAFEVVRLGEKAALARRYERAGDISLGMAFGRARPRGILNADEWDQLKVGDVAVFVGHHSTRLY